MEDASTGAPVAAGSVGTDYQPELKRTLGSFQVFAISFAFISVAVGIFGTYDSVLQSSGPVGIWLWVVAVIGQVLVALVVAQFAARISLSGSSYQWASRLANPKIGWGFGWLTFCFLAIAVVAIANALASQAFMPLFGIAPDEGTARLITLVLLLAQAVIAVASTRIVGAITSGAVVVELVIVAVLAVALVIVVAVTGDGSAGNLTSRGVAEGASDYFAIGGGLMLAMIMGLATLVGFDSAANLAEEAKDPYRSVRRDRGIGLGRRGAGTRVLDRAHHRDRRHPRGHRERLAGRGDHARSARRRNREDTPGRDRVRVFWRRDDRDGLVCAARLAMSRDSRFPAHQLMRRVNPHTHTPIPATILIFVIGVVLMVGLPGDALLELITASTILPALIYGLTTVLYLSVRGRLSRQEGAFDLGRFELPVAISALVWSIVALFVLVTPDEALVPVLIVIGLILGGGVFFLGLLIFNREALETEPEDERVLDG